MAFTALRYRIAGMPLVLAGPMVRRVEPGAVTIWVALRLPCQVTLRIHAIGDDAASAPMATKGPIATRRIGERLHILAITADGLSLAAGAAYGYNLFFHATARETSDPDPFEGDLFAPRIMAASRTAAEALL